MMEHLSFKQHNMKPIRDKVLFKPFPPDTISIGGIYVPESARQINNKGEIIEVGKGTKDKPMKLKAGDIGYRVKEWGQEILIDGELYFLIEQDAIIAKE